MGLIHIIEQDFAEDKTFPVSQFLLLIKIGKKSMLTTFPIFRQAFERSVTLLQQMKRNPVLVALGEDDDMIDPTVKIFHTERFDKDNNPVVWKTLKISSKQQIFPVR